MIQRIQTLFLLGAVFLLSALFFFPLAEFYSETIQTLYWNRLEEGGEVIIAAYSLGFLIGVIPLLLLVTIFLFKKRRLQMRFCVYNIILSIALVGFVVYHIIMLKGDDVIVNYKITLTFPLFAAVLIWLAFVNIRRDDLVIKSIDRLR